MNLEDKLVKLLTPYAGEEGDEGGAECLDRLLKELESYRYAKKGTDINPCFTCYYYRDGFCYRYPPMGDYQPHVNAHNWCGEYRNKFNSEEDSHVSMVVKQQELLEAKKKEEVKKEVERNEMRYGKCYDCAFFEIIDLSTIDKNGIIMQCHVTGFSVTVKDCIQTK